MAPLPVEQTGETGHGGAPDSQRTLPTPFLTKTYQLVDDPAVDDLISWNDDGSTFIVWRPAEFARDLLPKHFKHDNFSSFVRQLNTYGFRKVVPDRWEFGNGCFRRGEKGLLRYIQRRKISPSAAQAAAAPAAAAGEVTVAAVPVAVRVSPTNSGEEQVISSNSWPHSAATAWHRTTSCTTALELLEENERLRRENLQLSHELCQLRGLCNNILTLMTNYASSQLEGGRGGGGGVSEVEMPEGKPLELMPEKHATGAPPPPPAEAAVMIGGSPLEDDEMTPRLFGVSIGVKRVRREEEDDEDQQNQVQTCVRDFGQDVKSEPSDGNFERYDQNPWWLWLGK